MTQVRFARSELQVTAPGHFALVHYGEGELRERMFDFLSPALDDPKQAIYLCGPPGGASRLLGYLEMSAGRDLRAEVTERRIVLGEGDRDVDQQLQNLVDPVRELSERGFSPIRVAGPADWDVPGYSAPEDFLWYESRLGPALEGFPAAVMCTYDVARLPAAALLYGALETHSHTLINGVVSESPSFVPADQYLRTRLIHLPWLEPDEQRRDVNSAWEDRPERGPHSRTR
ncbi:MAG: MEDS domain-containing protein [Chloroflexota bacterium]